MATPPVETKRVCIIGGGASGLTSIKACLAEGLEPVCYEQTGHIGGLWNYRPDLPADQAIVMQSTVANTSKEMMAFSDFPFPDHFPNFMHNGYVMHYLDAYAEQFDLREHVRLNTRVEKVRRDELGWVVMLSTGSTERFDAVMVCVGHHSRRSTASLAGLDDTFGGRVLHSQQYREPSGFDQRRVLIVGIGNSALDAAVELSRSAARVFLSTRRGTWIWNRVAKSGMPFDINWTTRFYNSLRSIIPLRLINDYMENLLNNRMNHKIYRLRPAHRLLEQHPAINDQLLHCLATGVVTLKSDVKQFDATGVTFADETREEVDVVLVCTGYTFDYPFLEAASLTRVEDNRIDLYKFVFPPDEPTLSAIGLVQPIGAIQPISEMQARWAARVFAGRASLPPPAEQRADVERRRAALDKRFYGFPKQSVQVDQIGYIDEIAAEVGARPAVVRRLLRDPALGLRLFFGPNLPYAYRLDGSHSWMGARDAIINVQRRIVLPLSTRQPVVAEKWCLQRPTYTNWLCGQVAKVIQLTVASALFAGGYGLLAGTSTMGYALLLFIHIFCWGLWLMYINAFYDFGMFF